MAITNYTKNNLIAGTNVPTEYIYATFIGAVAGTALTSGTLLDPIVNATTNVVEFAPANTANPSILAILAEDVTAVANVAGAKFKILVMGEANANHILLGSTPYNNIVSAGDKDIIKTALRQNNIYIKGAK